MANSLRERQKQVARDMILRAAADEIVEKGLESISLHDVAERAGVSKRTLYNYFDSREVLLAAITEWSEQLTIELGGFVMLSDVDEIPGQMRATWRTWHELGPVFEAAFRIEAVALEQGRSPGRMARFEALVRGVAELRPELGDDRRDAMASLLHSLGSAPLYWRLTHEDGLDVDVAASLVAWNFALIRDALRRGEHPFPKEET